MKKHLRTLFLVFGLMFAVIATGCGGGGGDGSDADDSGNTNTSISGGFVLVQGATFNGSTAITGSHVFITRRTITIPSLLVCDHEVTQDEYQSVTGTNPSRFSGSDKPVHQVSWYDALVYCNKRSIAEQLTPCYTISGKIDPDEWGDVPLSSNSTWNAATCNFSANGYRLPTEAEWEYLARERNLTNSGQTTYSGSNIIDDVAWYVDNSSSVGPSSPNYGTHQVKTKAKNSLNLYDMSGNVWEWCWDWWSDSINASTPSTGAESGSRRVLRGGSWGSNASDCANSRLGPGNPYDGRSLSGGGVRVVRSVQ